MNRLVAATASGRRGLVVGLVLAAALAGPAWSAPAGEDLLAGARWEYSTDGGKKFSAQPVAVKAEQSIKVEVRTEFRVEAPPAGAFLEFTNNVDPRYKIEWKLNGKSLAGPIKGMVYQTFPGLDPKVVQRGLNHLSGRISGRIATTKEEKARDHVIELTASLGPVGPQDARIELGPILGAFGEDFFSVTCRTTLPAPAVLRAAPLAAGADPAQAPAVLPVLARSEAGYFHRFVVPRKSGQTRFVYEVQTGAREGGKSERAVATLPDSKADRLRFVALGDSRSRPAMWASVARAALAAGPELVIHSGDFVARGNEDALWHSQFYDPARALLSTVPFYAVIGNHERGCPLLSEVFYTPSKDGRSPNWAQTIGPVLLIGIDGSQKWEKDSTNTRWLRETLMAAADAKFIFLVTHYPAWTSSKHGKVDDEGEPKERGGRQGREVILPILEEHHVTAMIAGHDHCYERSEPPGGVTVVTSGGAGAYLYKPEKNAIAQNPYSKVMETTLNFCVFTIQGDTCTMIVLTPEGKQIDTRTWKARK